MDSKQVKVGAVLAYILIIINSLYGLIIMPYVIGVLGSSEYGVYRTIASFSAALVVLDLGIGSTIMRYVAKFRAEQEQQKIENFSAMCIIQAVIISLTIVLVSMILYNLIDATFSRSLSVEEIIKAKQLFIVLIINICCHVFENVVFGIIAGCNRFIFGNSVKLAMVLIRIILVFTVLAIFENSLVLVFIDLVITILAIVVQVMYLYGKLHLKIKYYFWDKGLFIESSKYTGLLFVQSIASQANGNVDNIVVGALVGPSAVTIYSIGLLIYNMYEQLAVAISDLMLPTVTNQIQAGDSNRDLENTVIRVGRMQFVLLGGAMAGFLIIGREFINLWLGNSFHDAWLIAVILMLPTTIPLVQNVCLSILRAHNKLGFRTWAVLLMAGLNVVITIVGVSYFGYIAAAVGTAIAIICANIIAMNIYYYRVLGINSFRIFGGIFRKIALCLVVSSVVLMVVDIFMNGSWITFLIKSAIFCVVYAFLLFWYGLDKDELKAIFSFRSGGVNCAS